jgi:hypothetical protein
MDGFFAAGIAAVDQKIQTTTLCGSAREYFRQSLSRCSVTSFASLWLGRKKSLQRALTPFRETLELHVSDEAAAPQ